MAERRMFAKTIVLSDAFLDMPMSARCLYFTLSMVADDDGFVNSPKSIMRQCGATDDDAKILLAKKFVIAFDSGVIVIKHWRINNYLRSDRHIDTKYGEELSQLSIDENGGYTTGIPTGRQLVYRGKDSIDKDSIDNIDGQFDTFWKAYPNKKGKQDAVKSFKKLNPSDELFDQMMKGLEVAKGTYDWKKDNGRYIPHPSTWLNGRRWEDDYGSNVSAEGRDVDESRIKDIDF